MTCPGILYLNHTATVGGAETSLLGLLGTLDRVRYQPVAAVPPGPLCDRIRAMDIPVLPIPMQRMVRTRNPVTLARYALSMRRVSGRLAGFAREQGVRLVHSNSNTAHLYGAAASRRAGVPCLWHSRDLVDLGRAGSWLYKHATGVIAISEAVAERVRGYGRGDREGRVSVIHNGVDPERFKRRGVRNEVREALGIGGGRFVVAMIAHLIPWKRHNVFLQAAGKLAEEVLHAHFLVIGGDPFNEHADYRRSLENMVMAQHLRDQVTFTGARDDIPALLEAVDVVMHPALEEPFGRVIVEAMAAGKPVIAVASAGPREIIRNGEDGVLVPAGTPQELALAGIALAGHEDQRERLGSAARERVASGFTLSVCVRKIEALYDRMLESRGEGRS
jgi:glycosyltransferase involved in cell wall biosynthesis